jgi:hypothetical protein
MKKIAILFFHLIFSFNFSFSQKRMEIDTFDISILSSYNVILFSSTNKLINFLGKPDKFSLNRIARCIEEEKRNNEKDYKYDVITYINPYLNYIVDNDSVRLWSIYFDKKHRLSIEHPLITFDKDLRIEDFIKVFQIKEDRVSLINRGLVPFTTSYKNKYYCITFICAETCDRLLSFYFDEKGYLKVIYFPL